MKFILYSSLGLFIASCAQHPGSFANKAESAVKIPSHFQTKAIESPEISQSLLALFNSEGLRNTVNKALTHNLDLKIASSRLEEAGYNLTKSQSPLLPAVNHNGSLGRSRSAGGFGSTEAGRFSQSFDARWELDLWGRIKSNVSAARTDKNAIQADFQAARQSIAAQAMQAWFDLTAAEQLLRVSQRRLSSLTKTYQLLDRRFEAGTAELGDVDLAKIDLENTKATLAQRANSRDQAARRINILTGSYPSKNISNSNFGSLRRGVKAGVPSTVLLKRPDINAAYQRILSADAKVTATHRDQFPKFNLTSSLGTSGTQLKNLAQSGFSTWSLLGSVASPLFDAGQRKAELGASSKRAEQAYLNYQKVVLNALSEVENTLGSESYLKQREASTQQALTAAINAEARIKRQYEAGLVEILTLLDTQRRRFNTEENLINIKASRFKNRVSLALALGKGI